MSDLQSITKRVTILLLVISVGRIPVPWIHSHEWLGGRALVEHIRGEHTWSCECELPCGFHVHVFAWGSSTPRPNGVNSLPADGGINPYDRQERMSTPSNDHELIEHVLDAGQTKAPCSLSRITEIRSWASIAACADVLTGQDVRDSLCASCCVYLL